MADLPSPVYCLDNFLNEMKVNQHLFNQSLQSIKLQQHSQSLDRRILIPLLKYKDGKTDIQNLMENISSNMQSYFKKSLKQLLEQEEKKTGEAEKENEAKEAEEAQKAGEVIEEKEAKNALAIGKSNSELIKETKAHLINFYVNQQARLMDLKAQLGTASPVERLKIQHAISKIEHADIQRAKIALEIQFRAPLQLKN